MVKYSQLSFKKTKNGGDMVNNESSLNSVILNNEDYVAIGKSQVLRSLGRNADGEFLNIQNLNNKSGDSALNNSRNNEIDRTF